MEKFIINGILVVRQPEVGFTVAREAVPSEAPTITEEQAVRMFARDGRCFAGDDQFNWAIEVMARRLALR